MTNALVHENESVRKRRAAKSSNDKLGESLVIRVSVLTSFSVRASLTARFYSP